MNEQKLTSEWKAYILPAVKSKVEELHLMGYSRATVENVWECLNKKVWKGNPSKMLHEVVQDVLHLNSGVYMNFLTIQAYQQDDLLAQIQAIRSDIPKDA